MSTMRQMVSDVRSTHRILSTDSMITDRAIASEIRNGSLLLIKRETNLRKLWATDTIFITLPCVSLIEVPITECAEYPGKLTIARSKYKIPKIAEGNYNYVIQGVYSINVMGGTGVKLKEITINRFLNMMKLGLKKRESYFWINNDYLYVTNSDVEKIRVTALFEDDIPSEVLYPGECGCDSTSVTDEEYCKNPLDKKFFLPGYLRKQVLQLVSQTLRESYFQIKSDNTSEGIDGQQSNASPTN